MSNTNPLDFTGKVILITGGAQGIGFATAQLCAARGASVVIADYNAEAGQKAVANLRQQSDNVDFVTTDVREPEQVKALIDFIVQKYGRLDRMLCAAGILLGPWLSPEDLPIEDFMRTQDVNVKGSFLCAKYATPHLEASGNGVIILIASGAGVKGPSSSLAYGTSKGGVNGLGMTLEEHLKNRHIRVNVLCPGNIVTQMKMSVDVAAAQRDGRPVEDAYRYAEQNYGVPEGIARLIAVILSDEADYLRGTLFSR
jgi:NAD(P)-dependent dehydrogenase (short-subunit alcohol dehydrogenase family)